MLKILRQGPSSTLALRKALLHSNYLLTLCSPTLTTTSATSYISISCGAPRVSTLAGAGPLVQGRNQSGMQYSVLFNQALGPMELLRMLLRTNVQYTALELSMRACK